MEPDRTAALLSNITAQFRGPMSNLYLAISRMASAKDRQMDPILDARAAALDQSYYQLLRLTNNLLFFQTLERQTPLLFQNQDLAALVGEIFDQVDQLARLRGLETRLLCPMDRLPCVFSSDGIRQLLGQLLSNAFKFTPPGGCVTLELALSQGQVLLAVADTGPGIPPEQRAALFTCWQQDREVFPPHGAGLGLAICQGVAKAHDGILTLDEQVSQGCRFVFSMPRRLTTSARFSDVPRDYNGGFNPCLVALSDALPPEAFLTI